MNLSINATLAEILPALKFNSISARRLAWAPGRFIQFRPTYSPANPGTVIIQNPYVPTAEDQTANDWRVI